MPTLISPVKTCKPDIYYGQAGDAVTIVAEYGHVVIVELKNERFSVRKDNLTNDKRATVMSEPLTNSKIIANKAPAKPKGNKAGATNNSLLF
jgi:hypothetical protein